MSVRTYEYWLVVDRQDKGRSFVIKYGIEFFPSNCGALIMHGLSTFSSELVGENSYEIATWTPTSPHTEVLRKSIYNFVLGDISKKYGRSRGLLVVTDVDRLIYPTRLKNFNMNLRVSCHEFMLSFPFTLSERVANPNYPVGNHIIFSGTLADFPKVKVEYSLREDYYLIPIRVEKSIVVVDLENERSVSEVPKVPMKKSTLIFGGLA